MAISAFPLQWPTGWPRTPSTRRKSANWSKVQRDYRDGAEVKRVVDLTLSQGVDRVLLALERFGVDRQDIVISSNVRTRLDGLPRSGEPEPNDPGVAAYWQDRAGHKPRVMAIDIYDTVAGNLGAIAATLDAMRAIERHGGALILERAFTGFAALPNPNGAKTWRDIFGFGPTDRPSRDDIEARYRVLAQSRHPDRGGSDAQMAEINLARDQAREAIGPNG